MIKQLIDNAKHDNFQDHAVVLMAYDIRKALQKREVTNDETTN